jgi:hypothetical protein
LLYLCLLLGLAKKDTKQIMTAILGPLHLAKVDDTHFGVLSPIEFRLDSGKIVMAEVGFGYDGKSGAKMMDAIVPPFGSRGDMAWLLHDRIYFGHRELGETNFTRAEADAAMKEVLVYLGVEEYIIHGSYAAVRAGGLESWMNLAERAERDSKRKDQDDWLGDQ